MPKIDTRVYQEMRRKEKERRKKQLKNEKVEVIVDDNGEKISFDQYWMLLNRKMELRPWLKEIMWADFKARGLSPHETEAAYNRASVQFGLKL